MDLEYVQKELNNPDNKEVMDYLHKEVSQGWLVLLLMHMIYQLIVKLGNLERKAV